MRGIQLIGLMLWRGGLLLVASYALFRIARIVLRHADVPPQIQVGLALASAGAVLVIASLVVERMADRREEGELTD